MRHVISFSLGFAVFLMNLPLMDGSVFAASRFQTTQNPQTVNSSPQVDKQLQQIKSQLRKIGIGGTVTLFMKNSDEFHGTISQLDDDSLQIAEVDRRATFTVKLVDIRKVRQGLGYVNVFTGRRVTRSHTARIFGLILATAAIALPVILVATAKD
jgi:hypothetical protein